MSYLIVTQTLARRSGSRPWLSPLLVNVPTFPSHLPTAVPLNATFQSSHNAPIIRVGQYSTFDERPSPLLPTVGLVLRSLFWKPAGCNQSPSKATLLHSDASPITLQSPRLWPTAGFDLIRYLNQHHWSPPNLQLSRGTHLSHVERHWRWLAPDRLERTS